MSDHVSHRTGRGATRHNIIDRYHANARIASDELDGPRWEPPQHAMVDQLMAADIGTAEALKWNGKLLAHARGE